MQTIHILCVEDEPEVLEAILRDLAEFENVFPVHGAQSAAEAERVLEKIKEKRGTLGLILCDHIMPGESGVDFLIRLHKDPETNGARKVLLTGQAGLEPTIRAVNEAGLRYYLAKPWTKEELSMVVKRELTDFVLLYADNLPLYMGVLDAPKLSEAMFRRGVSDR